MHSFAGLQQLSYGEHHHEDKLHHKHEAELGKHTRIHHDYQSSHEIHTDEVVDAAVAPPLQLKIFLESTKQSKLEQTQLYNKLLTMADHANYEIKQGPVNIEASFKYTYATRDPNESIIFNSSLSQIFMFYATLDQVYTSSFSAAALQNETMNYKELLLFALDFKIIPKLLSNKELRYLFKMKALQVQAETYVAWNKMNFTDFKDFLIRIATFSYNKVGLKRLILSINGFRPSSVDMVEYFCNYINLTDEKYIVNHIKTVGAATQARLNYKSAGDDNTEHNIILLSNLREGNRMSSAMNNDGNEMEAKLKYIKSTILERSEPRKVNARKTPKLDLLKAPKSKSQSLSHLLPPELYDAFYNKNNNNENDHSKASLSEAEGTNTSTSIDDNNATAAHTHSEAPVVSSKKLRSSTTIYKQEPYRSGIDDNKFRYDNDNDSVGSEDDSIFKLEDQLDGTNDSSQLIAGYDPSLVRILNKYCYVAPLEESSEIYTSEGPFMDLGTVPMNAACVVRLHITNKDKDDLRVDVTCRDFESDNARVITFPGRLIAGFTRPVSVSFTTSVSEKAVLGKIDVTCISVRSQKIAIVTCPVFYKVGLENPFDEKSSNQLCTYRTLPTLLLKNLSVTKGLDMSFDNKKLNQCETYRASREIESIKRRASVSRKLSMIKASRSSIISSSSLLGSSSSTYLGQRPSTNAGGSASRKSFV